MSLIKSESAESEAKKNGKQFFPYHLPKKDLLSNQRKQQCNWGVRDAYSWKTPIAINFAVYIQQQPLHKTQGKENEVIFLNTNHPQHWK